MARAGCTTEGAVPGREPPKKIRQLGWNEGQKGGAGFFVAADRLTMITCAFLPAAYVPVAITRRMTCCGGRPSSRPGTVLCAQVQETRCRPQASENHWKACPVPRLLNAPRSPCVPPGQRQSQTDACATKCRPSCSVYGTLFLPSLSTRCLEGHLLRRRDLQCLVRRPMGIVDRWGSCHHHTSSKPLTQYSAGIAWSHPAIRVQ